MLFLKNKKAKTRCVIHQRNNPNGVALIKDVDSLSINGEHLYGLNVKGKTICIVPLTEISIANIETDDGTADQPH